MNVWVPLLEERGNAAIPVKRQAEEVRTGTMPFRKVVTRELSILLGVLSHPDRIRLIEELAGGEKDVGTLAQQLGTTPVRVSQYLSTLRSHRLVCERREGRHVFYHLEQPKLAAWLLEGLEFVGPDAGRQVELQEAVASAVETWNPKPPGRVRKR
jgi:DNA-binding transcriptional ArsR family regulator